MSSTYIYAGTRAKTLERKLLSETQLELLVSAKSVDEMHKVLYDTYLAPYLSKKNSNTITDSLDKSIVDVKKTLRSISPHPEILNILWIKYDFHNLKTILKAKKANLSDETIFTNCFKMGTVSPEKLLKSYMDHTLQHINPYLKEATDTALEAKQVFEIDLSMNKNYFRSILGLAEKSKYPFIIKFVTLLIDLFNIKASLRADTLEKLEQKDVYVQGGTISQEELALKDNIIKLLHRFGGEKQWLSAIEESEKTGKCSALEKVADEYVSSFLKKESLLVFTPASLFSYFYAQKNNAQIIGAILIAKKTGMREKGLRTILRRLYV